MTEQEAVTKWVDIDVHANWWLERAVIFPSLEG
jgi:hypothetical protein